MANVLISEDSMTAIADAIRAKNGTQNTYKPAQMADAISAISGGGITPTGTKSITANGTYDVTAFASAEVNVPTGSTPTGTKEISITANGTTTEDVTNYASAQITANVPNSYTASDEGKVVSSGALVSQTSDTVTTNDTYDTTLINSLTVNVSGSGDSYAEDFKAVLSRTGDNPTLPSDLTKIGANAFTNYTSLTSITLPSGVTGYIGGSAFQNCSNLSSIDLPASVTGADANAFNSCNSLATVVLRRSDAVFNLISQNVFTNTPIRGYNSLTGTVYVPRALIDSYKAAPNWSAIYSAGTVEFVAIEGSIYE